MIKRILVNILLLAAGTCVLGAGVAVAADKTTQSIPEVARLDSSLEFRKVGRALSARLVLQLTNLAKAELCVLGPAWPSRRYYVSGVFDLSGPSGPMRSLESEFDFYNDLILNSRGDAFISVVLPGDTISGVADLATEFEFLESGDYTVTGAISVYECAAMWGAVEGEVFQPAGKVGSFEFSVRERLP